MNNLLILFLSCLVFNCFSQTEQNPDLDINQLCKSIGSSSQIIGLGESTHGTKEFTSIRSKIAKELILDYNFRLFVLEADFVPCARINEYVLTGKGNSESLLKDVLLWPWINQEFLNLILWIRGYNIKNPTDPVLFYGMDSQLSRLYASKDSILTNYPTEGNLIAKIVTSESKPKNKVKELRKLSTSILNEVEEIDLKLHYYIFCQINRIANLEYKDLNVRDENMASLVKLISEKLKEKMILWAHNGHLWRKKPSIWDVTSLGYHLGNQFGDKYKVVGMDFKDGSFNAVSYDKIDYHERRVFEFKSIKETLSQSLDFSNSNRIIIDCAMLEGKYYLNSIGAIYVNDPEKGDAYTSKAKKNREFDYLVICKESTPTTILIE